MIIFDLILSLLVTLFFFPISVLSRFKFGMPKAENDGIVNCQSIDDVDLANINYDNSDEGQDRCKWDGLLYYATQKYKDWLHFFSNYIDKDKCHFVRQESFRDVAFSGDMLAGLVLAVSKALKLGHMSDEQKTIIGKCCFNVIFLSWIPFRFAHSDYSRGFLSTINIRNGQIYHKLSLLYMSYLFNIGFKKYLSLAFYYIYIMMYAPNLLFGNWDGCFRWWIVQADWSYATHSDMALFLGCYNLGMTYAENGLRYIFDVHGYYNVDIVVMYGEVYPLTYDEKLWCKKHLYNLMKNRSTIYNDTNTIKVINIKDMEIIEELPFMVVSNRCGTATWEKLGRGSPNSNKSDMDLIFSGLLLVA